jgi:hypothetical protein
MIKCILVSSINVLKVSTASICRAEESATVSAEAVHFSKTLVLSKRTVPHPRNQTTSTLTAVGTPNLIFILVEMKTIHEANQENKYVLFFRYECFPFTSFWDIFLILRYRNTIKH